MAPTIPVSEETKSDAYDLKGPNDTWDDVVRMLLETYDDTHSSPSKGPEKEDVTR